MNHLSLSARSGFRRMHSAVAAALSVADCANYAGISSDKHITRRPTSTTPRRACPARAASGRPLDWANQNQFGDPQLPKLIAEALEGNPTIAQTQARIAKASSYIESSRSSLYPKVNGQYSWTRELYSGNALFPPPYGGTWFSENNALASA